ncbi:PREDICTED: HEAT repeat-containing protein 6 isoform X1 [Theobroma cacao]|uniref:HEAT repeat-containing protein 6 isoform X1 n=1 Tax=Theobroma cacao TaxID=3641 RepID=A0AB32W5M3_THECC|nr:PREDICTED: HEAT repeat-containing protein 6 isoform X1 [Theobroma cacao]
MATSSSSLAASAAGARSWRTAFLTLRDETLSNPPSIHQLVQSLLFSHSHCSFISAASDLPAHEVTSDLLFLIQLVANASQFQQDWIPTFSNTCHLIHDVSRRVSLDMNSSLWTLLLDSFTKMMDFFLAKKPSNAALYKPVLECLETLRYLVSANQRKCSLSDDIQLVNFLLHIIARSHVDLISLYRPSGNQKSAIEMGKKSPRYGSLWEVQTTTFTMLGEVYSRTGSSFPVDTWQSTIQILRKMMDSLASKNLVVEDIVMSRFYVSLLHCLHLVLMDPKGSISEHVSGFVASLRMFFVYGLTGGPQLMCAAVGSKENEPGSLSLKLTSEEPKKTNNTPYRPPHLRKKEGFNMRQAKAQDAQSSSDHDSSMVDITSSDSDYSDNDGSLNDINSSRCSKVRVSAIVCVQDLCQADPKSFTAQWTMLLPTNDVLQPRKFEATLMASLLFDPYLKARMASASALAVMMDGPATVFLQVAEYKESTKCESFMALSSSLGQILMQLHTGILYLIQHETNSRLLVLVFKILMLLISCTPYSRMPIELLPKVIMSLQARIEAGFPFKSDQTGLQVAAISCLTAALSVSPLIQVKEMILEEVSTGSVEAEKKSGVLFTLLQHSERLSNPTICFEALQALRALSHNYPDLMLACWGQISAIVHKFLREASAEIPTKTWKEQAGNTVLFVGEKIVTSAIKVLDECLRAISGFKGTEDLSDEKFLDTPFTSDCIRIKKISSAPSYAPQSVEDTNPSGIEQWAETIENHMPLILWHASAMVRTASVTCFAGITSSVFFTLPKGNQEFVVSSLISAAMHDEVPSVRSAACRAIGVVSCFQKISESAEILGKFIHAVESNTRDPVVSVRIPASWALANICDCFRHFDSDTNSQLVELLTECALHLTKDGDKIKSNAVRALGNLARFVRYSSSSCVHNKPVVNTGFSSTCNNVIMLSARSDPKAVDGDDPASLKDLHRLESMVQAFISCVTTGNVKVQWNVCHALSNLFLNKTIQLQDMDWAPSVFGILLLLLRDSSNFKIRIQAAAALAVPASALDYGKSFPDIIQGLEHVVENLCSDQISVPSSFKYRVALEKQLTSTMLHVLSLASATDHQPLKDFLVKKAFFLEDWFKMLCSLLRKTGAQPEIENDSIGNQKKAMISKALQALIEVYDSKNQHTISQKFKKLVSSIS